MMTYMASERREQNNKKTLFSISVFLVLVSFSRVCLAESLYDRPIAPAPICLHAAFGLNHPTTLHLFAATTPSMGYSLPLRPFIRPICMRNLDMPGWAWTWVCIPDGTWAYIWTDLLGLSNISLFIRTWGTVGQLDPNGAYFYVDDGSRLWDGTQTQVSPGVYENNPGVRVECSGASVNKGDFVVVDGISSVFDTGDGYVRRLLRCRSAADVQVLQPVISP
jgi:hypothetical protein